MKNFILIMLIFLLSTVTALGAEGLVSTKSPLTVKKTMDRLESLVQQKGMKVFARIDHAKGAASVGKTLRPTELLIFGNPQGGTPFMECAQTVGIDLPLKALVWEDVTGQVWLGYNAPLFLARRHEVPDCAVAEKMTQALAAIAAAVTAP